MVNKTKFSLAGGITSLPIKSSFYWKERKKNMTVYVLKYDNENEGAYDEYTKAYDKGMELSAGIEEDFDIDTLEVQ